MTARHALVEALKAACRGVLSLLLSGILWCMRASGASISPEETSVRRSRGSRGWWRKHQRRRRRRREAAAKW